MPLIVDEERKKAYPAVQADKEMLKAVAHPLRFQILELLSQKSLYLSEIARTLGTNEQRVFYHLNLLKKIGLIVEDRSKSHAGLKYFKTIKKGLVFLPEYVSSSISDIKLSDFVPVPGILEGFIEDGKIRCKVVVGAPFPHGRWNKGSRSSYLAGEVAVVFGKYGKSEKRMVYWDIELDEEDKKDNLVIIAGMHVNTLQDEVNNYLPVRFDEHGTKIISTISNEEYTDPDCGFICVTENPFDKTKKIIVISGLESFSTKAAVFAFKNYLEKINRGNMYNRAVKARVIRGIEVKGEVKDVVFLE